jgi:hypothetical protein
VAWSFYSAFWHLADLGDYVDFFTSIDCNQPKRGDGAGDPVLLWSAHIECVSAIQCIFIGFSYRLPVISCLFINRDDTSSIPPILSDIHTYIGELYILEGEWTIVRIQQQYYFICCDSPSRLKPQCYRITSVIMRSMQDSAHEGASVTLRCCWETRNIYLVIYHWDRIQSIQRHMY